MLLGLRTLGFPVQDLAAARDWYARVLGFAPYFDEPFYVGFEVGGYELGLFPAEGGSKPSTFGGTTYFGSDALDADILDWTSAGASVIEDAHEVGGGIRVATLGDPFGNKVGLISNPHFRVPALGSVTVCEPPQRIVANEAGLSARRIALMARVPVGPRAAFDLWTSSEAVARWLLPESRIELKIGGAYELDFLDDQPSGMRGSDGCRILSYLPGRMLSFTWNSPPELARTRPLHTWVVVEFSHDDGGTRVELSHLGWPEQGWDDEGSQWPETYGYFEVAWARLLSAFEGHFDARGSK
jgi:uncharacterized protein YndB with AHSA1/START domain/predicted enzyme related to lactoylglutathione lyase